MSGRTVKAVWGWLALAFLICMLVPATGDALAAGTTVSISSPAGSVGPNDSFTVEVLISSDTATRGAQFGLSYDPSRVKLEGVVEGSYYRSWAQAHRGETVMVPAAPAIDNTAGRVSFVDIGVVGGDPGGPTGSGVLATLRFRGQAGGVSPLKLTDVIVSTGAGSAVPNVAVANGSVTVSQTGPAPTPTVGGNGTPTLSLYLSNPSVSVGQSFIVDVVMSSYTPTRGVQFGLEFDPTKVRLDRVLEGPFFRDWALANGATTVVVPDLPLPNVSGHVGVVNVAVMGGKAGGLWGTGTVVSYQFTALGVGSCGISLRDAMMADGAGQPLPAVAAQGAQVSIGTSQSSDLVATGTTTITATLGAAIQITPPQDITRWNLQVGSNSMAGTLNVKSNSPWRMDVSDSGDTLGHMAEWDGQQFGGRKLKAPMLVRCLAANAWVALPGPGMIARGDISAQRGNFGQDLSLSFDQAVDFTDPALGSTRNYRMLVTFTGYVTL